MNTQLSFPLPARSTNERWQKNIQTCLKVALFTCKFITTLTIISITAQRRKVVNMKTFPVNCSFVDIRIIPFSIHWNLSTHFCTHAYSVLPSVNTKMSQSPNCVLLRRATDAGANHVYIQYKVTLQLKHTHTDTAAQRRHGFICLPTCNPRLLRMLDSSMVQSPTYHASSPVHCHAALPSSSLLLPPSLPQAKSDLSSC